MCHRANASKLLFSLQALHTDDPLTWDYVARRELEVESQPAGEQPATKQARAVELGRKEERCCAVYEEAVKTLPTGDLHQTSVWCRGGSIQKHELKLLFPLPKSIFRNFSVVIHSMPDILFFLFF